MKPLTILIGVHHFPPRFTGGAEWRAFRTAAALQARGHQVQVVSIERIDAAGNEDLTWVDDIFENIPIQRLSMDLHRAPVPARWEYANPWIETHFSHLVSTGAWDLFHLISGYLLGVGVLHAAQTHHIPTCLTFTDYWFACRRINLVRSDGRLCSLPITPQACLRCQAEEKRRYRWPGRLAPRLADLYWSRRPAVGFADRQRSLAEALSVAGRVIAPSRFMYDFYASLGVNPHQMRFMRQGRPGQPPSSLAPKPAPSGLRLGYIGQIAPHKGTHLLLEAIRKVASEHLSADIYGDGSRFPAYTRRLKRLARSDPRLRLLGVFKGQDALDRIYRELDVLVVPSLWFENSPNVILEAFDYGLPVIASNLGGMAELVQPEVNGLLFRPGDPEDLARQVRRLLEEPGLLARLRSGIQPVKRLDQEIDELESLYAELLNENVEAPRPA